MRTIKPWNVLPCMLLALTWLNHIALGAQPTAYMLPLEMRQGAVRSRAWSSSSSSNRNSNSRNLLGAGKVQVMGRCVSCAGVPRSACLLFPSWLLRPISSVFAYISKQAVAAPMHDACCWPHNCSCCSAMQQGRTTMQLHPRSPHSNTTTSGSVLLHDMSTTASHLPVTSP